MEKKLIIRRDIEIIVDQLKKDKTFVGLVSQCNSYQTWIDALVVSNFTNKKEYEKTKKLVNRLLKSVVSMGGVNPKYKKFVKRLKELTKELFTEIESDFANDKEA